MPQATTRALVLAASPWNEQDKLVSLLTAEAGLLRAVAPGAAKLKNRFGSLLELFTAGDFQYYWREEKELVTLSKGEIRRSFFSVVSAAPAIFYFSTMAEIILKFVPLNQRDSRLHNLLLATLSGREEGRAMDWLLLYFLVWFLRAEGLLFHAGRCSSCGAGLTRAWVRSDFRGLLCPACRSDERFALGREELAYILWTKSHHPRDSESWQGRFSPGPLVRLLVAWIEYHGEMTLQSGRCLPEFR
jgi:DNA repair protein RecO (recombination protein O)